MTLCLDLLGGDFLCSCMRSALRRNIRHLLALFFFFPFSFVWLFRSLIFIRSLFFWLNLRPFCAASFFPRQLNTHTIQKSAPPPGYCDVHTTCKRSHALKWNANKRGGETKSTTSHFFSELSLSFNLENVVSHLLSLFAEKNLCSHLALHG